LHEPDNRFLECALAASAEFIVTVNTAPGHFDRKQYQAVSVMRPGEFLNLPEDGRFVKKPRWIRVNGRAAAKITCVTLAALEPRAERSAIRQRPGTLLAAGPLTACPLIHLNSLLMVCIGSPPHVQP